MMLSHRTLATAVLAALLAATLGSAATAAANAPAHSAAPTPAKPATAAATHPAKPHAPWLGQVELGAFAPESALHYGIDSPCLMLLDDNANYVVYRNSVRAVYGADLSDMNYLGVGMPNWEIRCQWLRDWLLRAAKYGDPTVALEPLGPTKYGVFHDGPEMRELRGVFQKAQHAGITVWVRFCSEANDQSNPYTVVGSPEKIAQYRAAAKWFRSYMPSNVKLVFCPLINDVYPESPTQVSTLKAMYSPGDYDRIGGTIYATSWVDPEPAYSWYYDFMSKLDPRPDFQISELGGTFTKKDEVYSFLVDLKNGKWPKVDRVNLFAGELNSTAIENHGHFGLVLPGEYASYLKPLIAAGTAPITTVAKLSSAHAITVAALRAAIAKSAEESIENGYAGHYDVTCLPDLPVTNDSAPDGPVLSRQYAPPPLMPIPVASAIAASKHHKGWRSDEMTLRGTTLAADATYQTFVLLVTDETDANGAHITISPARKKRIYLQPDAMITAPDRLVSHAEIASLKGSVMEVTGFDQGEGTPLQATDILVTAQ